MDVRVVPMSKQEKIAYRINVCCIILGALMLVVMMLVLGWEIIKKMPNLF